MSKNQVITLVVLAVIIIVGIIWARSNPHSSSVPIVATSTDMTATDTTANPQGAARINGDTVFMSNQKPSNKITVDEATILEGGFVAIHEDNNGAPGAIIGVSNLLPTGESTGITITLNRQVKNGETLYAMLHTDNNGDGKFQINSDLPIQGADGNIVMTSFMVDTNATTTVHATL